MQPSESHAELLQRLNMLGWKLKAEKTKNGLYIAVGTDPMDDDHERIGTTVEMALANLYRYAIRWNSVMLGQRSAALVRYSAWHTNWIDQRQQIAQAYADLPTFDEKAAPAWKALAAESKKQADAIRQQVKVEVTDNPDPYPSIHAMIEDVHHNQHFVVSRAYTAHPVWSADDVVNFRVVHDVLGHAQTGAGFDWEGENLACGAHFPLLTPLAREALFTQCIGQGAYRGSFHGLGPQKIGFMDQFLHPVQEREGEHTHVPHGGLPQDQIPTQVMDTATAYGWDKDDNGKWREVKPKGGMPVDDRHQTGPFAEPQPMQPFAAKMVSPGIPVDPNEDWEPRLPHELKDDRGIVPPAVGDRDYLDAGATARNAAKIDTQWWQEPPQRQEQAIMNAFRVALLSPRKHIRFNAAHYQALMHHDPKTSAVDLWDTLERAREDHNQKLGFAEGSHLAYRKQLDYLAHKIQEDNPELSTAQAMKEAKATIFNKVKEFEALIDVEQAGLMDKPISDLKRYNMARKRATEWIMEHYSPGRGWAPGQMEMPVAKTALFGWGEKPGLLPGENSERSNELEWQNGMNNHWPKGYDPMAEALCPHCGRPVQPGSDVCPVCQHEYAEAPTPETQMQYGVHPSQWPDSYMEPKLQKMVGLWNRHNSVPGNGAAYYYAPPMKALFYKTQEPLKQQLHPSLQQWAQSKGMRADTVAGLLDQMGVNNSKLRDDQNAQRAERAERIHGYSVDALNQGKLVPVEQAPPKPAIPQFTGATDDWHQAGAPGVPLGKPYLNGKPVNPGDIVLASDEWQPGLFDAPQQEQPMQDMSGFASDQSKYGAFMGAHLDAIAEVGQHIEEIRALAQKDLEEGGKGFVFRNGVMNMNLPGVGPKVASFVWLLLAPSTSDLGIIDTHILRGLRAGSESVPVRDYYKMERMERTARDASGYKHMPLGMYHWGAWDMIRNPGHHSDHSALRVLDPLPWDSPEVQWDPATTGKEEAGFHGWTGPNQFEMARPFMEQAAHEFDSLYGDQPRGQVPNVLIPDRPDPYGSPGVIAKPTRPTLQEQTDAWIAS